MKKIMVVKKKAADKSQDKDYAPTGNHDSRRESLLTLFKNEFQWLSSDKVSGLEQAIYQETINLSRIRNLKESFDDMRFRRLYEGIARRVYLNLNPDSYVQNDYLKQAVLDGKVQLEKIPSMNCSELFPERWKSYNTKVDTEVHTITHGQAVATTTIYRCGRCKNNNCTYVKAQARSMDEGETHFITCLTCGKNWKHHN